MFVQTEITPNPNSLKFIPGKAVSNAGSFEITKKDEVRNELVKNIFIYWYHFYQLCLYIIYVCANRNNTKPQFIKIYTW